MIQNVKVYGLEDSIKRSKYPKAVDISKCTSEITKTVNGLATCQKGEGHDNFLKGIIVQFDLTFTIKTWVQGERYHWFDIISSQSVMHCIDRFEIEDRCIKYVSEVIVNEVKRLKEVFYTDKTMENFLNLVYSVPVGFKLTAGMTTNYQQLKTIYSQRKTHRLPEWQEFCRWVESLPHSEFITGSK